MKYSEEVYSKVSFSHYLSLTIFLSLSFERRSGVEMRYQELTSKDVSIC